MRLLLAGRGGFDYNRVRVILSGLRQVAPDGFEVFDFERRDRATGERLRALAEACDVIYVPPFRRLDVPFVRKYGAGRPILFDPLIGTYITRVVDFGWWWRKPLARWRDRRDFLAADHLLFDTEAHRQWAHRVLDIPLERSDVLYIGADTQEFTPVVSTSASAKTCRVGFYGSFAPLQGAEKVIEAAHLLRHRDDIEFEIVGDVAGNKAVAKTRARFAGARITYTDYLPFDELRRRVETWDICLGIFGDSEKANVVIPNKVYHYAALGKPFISRDTLGMREQFVHGRNAWLITPDVRVLAKAVEELVGDADSRGRLGRAAGRLISNQLAERAIAEELLRVARKLT